MEYTVFDCETTGLSPGFGDRICEIAAVKLEHEKIKDRYWSLVNPQREISHSAYLVNRITPEMIKDAPKMKEVLPSFLDFVGDSKFVAYNAGFDICFLNSELARLNYPLIPISEVVDVYALAKRILPELGFYPLWNVAKKLHIPVIITHRALADAQITAQVFIQLMKMAGEQVLKTVHLDYTQLLSKLKIAIERNQSLKVRFLTDEGEKIVKIILPCKIVRKLSQEFLEFKSENKLNCIPLGLIEEVL